MVARGSQTLMVLVHVLAFAARGSWQPSVDLERREKGVDSSSFHPMTSYHCCASSAKDDQGIQVTQKVIPCEIELANGSDLEVASELDDPYSAARPFAAGTDP